MLIKHRRLALALLLSLLIHALLLSLTFGSEGIGFPGFDFTWKDRRVEAPILSVVLVPSKVTTAEPAIPSITEPSQQASIEQSDAGRPVLTPSASPAPQGLPIVSSAKLKQNPASGTHSSKVPPHAAVSADTVSAPIAEVPVMAVEDSNEAKLVPPPVPLSSTSSVDAAPNQLSANPMALASHHPGDAMQKQIVIATQELAIEQAAAAQEAAHQEADRIEAARREAERQKAEQQAIAKLEAQQQEVARQEAARIEAEQREAEHREAEQQATAKLEVKRQEVARQEAARIEAARREAERRETERQAIAKLEAQRQEVARQETARIEAARQETKRQEAERQAAAKLEEQRQSIARQQADRIEAARREAERQEASRREATRVDAEQQEAEREERLRAIGRQLDEEAARRKAASTDDRQTSLLPRSLSTARRVRLWGRTHPDVELIQYAETWTRKIQFNTTVETVREVTKWSHKEPLVTVAIRSDGSVESVTFVVSSGVAEVDEAIRRMVEAQKPYLPFPPALARKYDVIEIRRTWLFDTVVRLQ